MFLLAISELLLMKKKLTGFKLFLKEIKDKSQTRTVMEATGGSYHLAIDSYGFCSSRRCVCFDARICRVPIYSLIDSLGSRLCKNRKKSKTGGKTFR